VAGGRVHRAPRDRRPERALHALHALTQRFTAEFAIRPFIVHPPGAGLRDAAALDAGPQRPCAPPGQRRQPPAPALGPAAEGLIADPSPTLPLLRALQDDPSEYVRRSVANHLNDIAKDHPALVAHWLADHLPERIARAPRAAAPRQPHADQGRRPPVLAAWGLDKAVQGPGAADASCSRSGCTSARCCS
jgi:hypothetical protein